MLRQLRKLSIWMDVLVVRTAQRNREALTKYGCTLDTDKYLAHCPGFGEFVREYPHLCSEPELPGARAMYKVLTAPKPAARI